MEVGLTDVPCWIQSPADRDILVRQVVENWQRADLHPLDLADTLSRIRDEQGLTQREIARRTGKPESEISRTLKLLTLDSSILAEARADTTGEIGRRHLLAIGRLDSKADQLATYEQVKRDKLTAEATERMVNAKRVGATSTPKRGAPLAKRFRFLVGSATVEVTFRRKTVEPSEVATVLERAALIARQQSV